jgi:hypothetical protein
VIRGGIGLFANTIAANIAANVYGNAPNKFSPKVTTGIVGLAAMRQLAGSGGCFRYCVSSRLLQRRYTHATEGCGSQRRDVLDARRST